MRLKRFIKYGFTKSLLILLIMMIIVSCKIDRKNTNKNNPQSMDNIDFINRTTSFSYIFFQGNHVDKIVSFLTKVNYKLLTRKTLSGAYNKVYTDLENLSDDSTIVKKGIFFKDGYTVLMDPEMVVGTYEKELIDLSKDIDNIIVVAIWERYSQTRALVKITKNGLESRTYLTVGQDAVDNVNTNKLLEKYNTETGLFLALDELKIPYKTLFGDNMILDVLTLKE